MAAQAEGALRTLVVVLNWNGLAATLRCLKALDAQTHPAMTVLVIDNGSADDSAEHLRRLSAERGYEFVAHDRNRGFAGGVNAGIRHGLEHGYEAVALINNDARPEPGWLAALDAALREAQAAIATGLLLHEDGTIDSTGDFYSVWGLSFPRGRGEPGAFRPPAGEVFAASGGGSAYRASLFAEIGLFDERFFAYYEDVDLSFRARLTGHRVWYTPDAVAYHERGAASSRVPGLTTYHTFKNLPLLFWRNVPGALALPVGLRFAAAYALILGNAVRDCRGGPALRGAASAVRHLLTGELAERRRIQRARTITPAHVRSLLWDDLPPEQSGLRRLRSILTGGRR